MPYDLGLVERGRNLLGDYIKDENIKMFGGLVFMINANMCCRVAGQVVMVRVAPTHHDSSMALPNVRPVTKGNRPMIGFLLVGGAAVESAADLKQWVALGLEHNRTLPPKSRCSHRFQSPRKSASKPLELIRTFVLY